MDNIVAEVERIKRLRIVFRAAAKDYRSEEAPAIHIPELRLEARHLRRVFTDIHMQAIASHMSEELNKAFDGFSDITRHTRRDQSVEFNRTAIIGLYSAVLHETAAYAHRTARIVERELVKKPEHPVMHRIFNILVLTELQQLGAWLGDLVLFSDPVLTITVEKVEE